ncbi:MAG: hypothetical protein WD208_02920 [Dehalococcoidia bacterium]
MTLEEDVEYQGAVYCAEGPARDQAWSPLACGLLAQLAGGVNADYQAGLAHFMSWSIFVGLGFMFTGARVFATLGGISYNPQPHNTIHRRA